MPIEKDYYSLLGVPRNASTDELRRAYREAAHRLHPDKNIAPGDTELFLDVGQAYETLIDVDKRAAYDKQLAQAEEELLASSPFHSKIQHSREAILELDEPQVHYILLDIKPAEHLPDSRPPVNLCLVIDRSTSMKGPRLDQVRSSVLTILQDMQPGDTTSIVAFSDKAEVIVSPEQAADIAVARARMSLLQAGGGTEIGQGLTVGLDEIHRNFTREGVNHLVLLTDGRTYGDEELCLELADQASTYGISINGVGIGSDWSDRLLDDLASRTGGNVLFLNTPRAVTDLLHRIHESLTQIVANRVRLEGALGQQVDLRSAFRILPDPIPLGDSLPVVLGHLPRDGVIRLLLEMVIHPVRSVDELTLAHFNVSGDILGSDMDGMVLPIEIKINVTSDPDTKPPPDIIVSALNHVALYRMQEKARHEAELGQVAQAARRLENLATHLLAEGERELAKAALNEAVQLTQARRLSPEGEKILKYGTRSLLLRTPVGEP